MDTTRATAASVSNRLSRPVRVLAAALAAGLASPAMAQQGATRTKDINAIVFQERVKAAVDGRVKGYAFVIADSRSSSVQSTSARSSAAASPARARDRRARPSATPKTSAIAAAGSTWTC